jgi:putative PEP-CTERM system TPR-repeat lipoprotein
MSSEDRLDRAEQALADGEYRAAIIDARDVLRKEPDNIRGRVLLGRASAAVGDGPTAEKELRRALELGVSVEIVAVPLARGLLQQQKYQAVVDEVHKDSLWSASQEVEMKLIRGDAYLGLELPGVAREIFSGVLSAAPNNSDARLGLASSFRAERDFNQARISLDKFIADFPDDVRGRLALASLDFDTGGFAGARSNFELAVELASESGDAAAELRALTGLAESQFALKQVDEARSTVARLTELAPESTQTLFLSSRVAFLDSDWKTAQNNLQRVLQQVPDFRPAQVLLGATHLQSGNLSQAEMYLAAAVAALPNDQQARRLLADTRRQRLDENQAAASLAPLAGTGDSTSTDSALAARQNMVDVDDEAVVDMLRDAVAEDPSNSELKFQLATALINAGRSDELNDVLDSIDVSGSVMDEFRRDLLGVLSAANTGGLDEGLIAAQNLVAAWPNNPDATNLLGSIQFARDDLAGARDSFSKTLTLQPGNLSAIQSLASLDEREGDFESAKSRLMIILELNPGSISAMAGMARLAALEENLADARMWLQRIRSADAGATQARASLARVLMAEGNHVEAERVLDETLRIDDRMAENHFLLGVARSSQGNYGGAVIAFDKALDLAPNNSKYRNSLAIAQRDLGNLDEAEQTLMVDGSIDLEYLPSAVNAAVLKVDRGDLEGAMQIARSLQERHPDSAIPWALEAEAHARAGRPAEAAEAYDHALSINVTRGFALRAHRLRMELGRADQSEPLEMWLINSPRDTEIRMVLAESLQASKRLDESREEYETVLNQDPDNGVALNNLAWVYYMVKDERAAATARKAFEVMPDNAAVADTLGWVLVESGEVAEGLQILRQAVDLSNGRAEVKYHYAVGLARSGDTDQARDILQEVVSGGEEFPDRQDAERFLANL